MSERFVEAFIVAPAKLTALLGTPDVGFAAVHEILGNREIWEDLVETIGDGDEESGLTDVTLAFDALAAGKPPTITYVERITQLVLHAHAEPLKPAMMEANFMPIAKDNGLWNPAFKALGMKTIAKQWGKSNLAFPHNKVKAGFGWPVITVVEPAAWKAELATPWRKKLAALPLSTFDPDVDEDSPYLGRDEVEGGIAVLEKWVTAACKPITSKKKAVAGKGNALVLVIDGDQ